MITCAHTLQIVSDFFATKKYNIAVVTADLFLDLRIIDSFAYIKNSRNGWYRLTRRVTNTQRKVCLLYTHRTPVNGVIL